MSRSHACTRSVVAAFALAAAPSALAQQPSGGATAPGPPQPGPDGSVIVPAKSDAMLGRTLRLTGRVPAHEAGRTVVVQRLDAELGWVAAARTVAEQDGSFAARWRTDRTGRTKLRGVVPARSGTARAATATPEVAITVYRPAVSTWYGPGFYGNTTACGLELTRKLVGLAHKTLPCGTQVAILYRGRTLTAPVVDRGPFREGTDWDLTSAAAQQLGLKYTDTIGAVRLTGVPPMATPAQAPPIRSKKKKKRRPRAAANGGASAG